MARKKGSKGSGSRSRKGQDAQKAKQEAKQRAGKLKQQREELEKKLARVRKRERDEAARAELADSREYHQLLEDQKRLKHALWLCRIGKRRKHQSIEAIQKKIQNHKQQIEHRRQEIKAHENEEKSLVQQMDEVAKTIEALKDQAAQSSNTASNA